MKLRPIYILAMMTAVTVFALVGCSKVPQVPNDPLAEAAARIASAPTTEAVIEQTTRTLDSLAAHGRSGDTEPIIKVAVRSICQALVDANRRTDAVAVVGMVYGLDFSATPEIGDRMLTSTLLVGKIAPAINGLAEQTNSSGVAEATTIILFHESACRTCQGMIWDLKQRYAELQKGGVRIVTISTDKDGKTWTEYAAGLPWPDKLCDYKGFNSPAMIAWGVPATPTMFLVDSNGIVMDQFGTTEDIFKEIFK